MNIIRMDFSEIAQAAKLIGRYQALLDVAVQIPEVEDYLFVQLSREDAFCFLAWPEHHQMDHQQDEPVGFMQVIPTMEALRSRSFLKVTDLFCFSHLSISEASEQDAIGTSLLLDAACELVQFRGDHGLIVNVAQHNELLTRLCHSRNWKTMDHEIRFFHENRLPVPIPS
jgi:hypothetical protein